MKRYHVFAAVAALALSAAPAFAQAHEHGQAAEQKDHAGMGMNQMVCTMGMLPHGQMMMGGGMKHGEAAGDMKHGEASGGMEHGGGMKHPVVPTQLIHHASDLALTPDQIAKVTELLTASSADCNKHLEMAMHAHHQAEMALGGADLAAYQAKLQEAFSHVLQGHVAVVKAGVEAKKLLTPAQIEKLGKH